MRQGRKEMNLKGMRKEKGRDKEVGSEWKNVNEHEHEGERESKEKWSERANLQ